MGTPASFARYLVHSTISARPLDDGHVKRDLLTGVDGNRRRTLGTRGGPCSGFGALVDAMMHGHIVDDEHVPRVDVHVVDVDAGADRHDAMIPPVGLALFLG
jgi:hypothetical protein